MEDGRVGVVGFKKKNMRGRIGSTSARGWRIYSSKASTARISIYPARIYCSLTTGNTLAACSAN